MSDVPPSNESPGRRATRLALGTSIGFLISQLVPWPVAHLLPVAVVGLLMDARPLSYPQGWKIFCTSVFFFFFGGTLAWLLSPWPLVLGVACGFMLYRMSSYMLTSGEHLFSVIACLIGFVVMPIVVSLLPAVGFLAAVGFSLDWGVAILIAWVAWLVMPRKAPLPEEHASEPLPPEMARELAWTLAVILTPLVVGFIVFSYSAILVAVYATIFATSFGSKAGRKSGMKYLVANSVYGALGMLICYELLVMVPEVTFLVPVIFVGAFLFSLRMFQGGPNAAFWESGIFGYLIMLGGILMKDDVVAASTLVERLWHLLLATAYVSSAYAVLELFRHYKEKWKKPAPREIQAEPAQEPATENTS